MSTKADPEIDAALQSVADGPLDEGRKRVFTDLLLERGDPRGEFMLLQFVISANQASGRVRQRAQELWQRHKKEWTKDVQGVLTDLELENGFPVAARIVKSPDPAVLSGAMFSSLKRLKAMPEGVPLLLAAAAHPKLAGLETLELEDAGAFSILCERGVPGRLRRLTLRVAFGAKERDLFLTSPATSKVERLTFQPAFAAPTRRRGALKRLRDAISGKAEPPGALTKMIEALDAHPTLEVIELPGAMGDVDLFLQVAPAWPKTQLARISSAGTFELEREEGGTLLVLQNFSLEQVRQVRAVVPKDVTRARLMRKRGWNEDPEALQKLWNPIVIVS